MLSSTGVNLATSASGSQLSGNTKKDKIQQTSSSAKKNKLEAYLRNYLDSGCSKHMTGDLSQLTNFVNKFLGTVKFALKESLSKHKGKAVINEAVTLHPIDPELLKIDVAPLAPKLRNNWTAHTDYLRHTQEETTTLREIVERVNLLSSASGSQPQGNTKNDRIQRTPRKAKKNKLEDHPTIVRPSLNKKKSVVDTKFISSVTNSKSNVNSDLKCATCNGCLFSDNHDSCVLAY
nr:integrase, catalytic region, zinc finger, CCHC-type, peptidase aspartic, catalytic [Tanacetum cinerariifolium]